MDAGECGNFRKIVDCGGFLKALNETVGILIYVKEFWGFRRGLDAAGECGDY